MSSSAAPSPFVAIACGGTGGHLFPGLAIAEQLQQRGCAVALLISPKEVDQQSVQSARGMEILTLPAVALQNRNYFSFAACFWRSWRAAARFFQQRRPDAVLAMGGFTSAPPILAAKDAGAKTFLHESNTLPGRANRFLARWVDEAFVGFPEAAARLKARQVTVTGTPVRSGFSPDPARPSPDPACRLALGLDPQRPVVLVMGGSQGASGLNDLILSALPLLGERASAWQWIHLTGPKDFERVQKTYGVLGIRAVVQPFLAAMDLALGAASVSVSRSGASSLAEIAARRLPSLLVPYPAAADNHQWTNARAFEKTGAAILLGQADAAPEEVVARRYRLMADVSARDGIQAALGRWHAPAAAERVADLMLAAIARQRAQTAARQPGCGCGHAHAPGKPAH